MIYILAPFSLKINTTSANRILSFYNALKQNGKEVKVVSPALTKKNQYYIHSQENTNIGANDDFIFLEHHPEKIEQMALASRKIKKSKWYFWNIVHFMFKGRDIHYSYQDLNTFFTNRPLNPNDILIASGPPSSLLIVAVDLTKKFHNKLILDYRDPWTYGYLHVDVKPFFNFLRKAFERKRENVGLKLADAILCANPTIVNYFPSETRHKTHILKNGANIEHIQFDKIQDYPDKFRLVYLGTLYYDQLQDERFFSCLTQFLKENNIGPSKFELCFVGCAKNKKLPLVIKKYQLEQYTVITPRLNISESMEIAYAASAFLHLKYNKGNQSLTSKQADYLALQKPILLPIAEKGELVDSISANQAGYVCNNTDECQTALENLWETFSSGRSLRIHRDDEFLYKISRQFEAEKLVDIVQKL